MKGSHHLLRMVSCIKTPCRNSPIAAGGKIQKHNIYNLRGNTNEMFLDQLVDYIKENVKEQNLVEFWAIYCHDATSLWLILA